MFTYCKRTKTTNNQAKESQMPYAYHTSKLNTLKGFGHQAHMCESLNQPWVQNRGVPRNLLDLEAAIKGRDRSHQPWCQATENDDEDLKFSTFRPPPVLPKGLPATAPVPLIEVRGYGGLGSCDHAARGPSCGSECRCPDRCQCKGAWRGMNVTKALVGPPGFSAIPSCKIAF
jgi:hypothetical protein